MGEELSAGLILAAGKGTRMKSAKAKVLHEVCGLPMLEWIVRAFEEAGVLRPIAVVGHGGDQVCEALGDRIRPVWQHEQLGTGHAAMMAGPALEGFSGAVVIVPGDAPAISSESLTKLLKAQKESGATLTLATVEFDDPTGYGRIIRSPSGFVEKIVEEADADPETKRIREVGVSVYCVDWGWAVSALARLESGNAQGEYYLTDLVGLAAQEGRKVVAHKFGDGGEFQGVNDRWQLSLMDTRLRRNLLKKHALAGVTIRNYEDTLIGPDVQLEPDVILESGVQLKGSTFVRSGSVIGPGSLIEDAEIGSSCKIIASVVRGSTIGDGVRIGPYAQIRPGSVIDSGCRIGNFVEVKNAHLASEVSASHLSYIGDAEIGPDSNIGAGVVLANYDGVRKHRTEVGEGVFLGSNTTIIAPVTIGHRSIVTAGSVLTTDVPDDAGAFGRARTEIKEGWAAVWRQKTKDRAADEKPK